MRIYIDANVFMSSWTLDPILSTADAGLFEPAWSKEVLMEYKHAAAECGRERTAQKIIADASRQYPSACITGWEHRVEGIGLPDPDDRHVVAAALEGSCDLIVTFNVRDFPRKEMRELGLEIVHPDELLVGFAEDEPESMLEVMRDLVNEKERPPRTMRQEIEGLRRCRLVRFADWLEAEAL